MLAITGKYFIGQNYLVLPVESKGIERILTYSHERTKTIDLFPRTEIIQTNYARPVPLHGKLAKNIPDINLMLSCHVETAALIVKES